MMFASTSIYDSMTLFVPQDLLIPNGCFDAYEVKVNKDIFKYTNSLVNADSFYANFTNTTFQKEPHCEENCFKIVAVSRF